jgi:hypothetical protein
MTFNGISFGLDCAPANLPTNNLKIERGLNS